MKENYLILLSKKIRKKLLHYTDKELKQHNLKTYNNENLLLINSQTPKELSERYKTFSDYCVKKVETYSNNDFDNNKFCHVSITYSSLNNNCCILVDDKNLDQYISQNNIMGKYYKGNNILIKATKENMEYNLCYDEGKLEKKVIGQKKFLRRSRRSILSSLNIHNIIGKKSNNNHDEKKISRENDHDFNLITKRSQGKMNTNCELGQNKNVVKSITQKLVNKYMQKLKKYCSHLKIINKKKLSVESIPQK